jgi:hypothetical protein
MMNNQDFAVVDDKNGNCKINFLVNVSHRAQTIAGEEWNVNSRSRTQSPDDAQHTSVFGRTNPTFQPQNHPTQTRVNTVSVPLASPWR